jgi:uncharacterized protein
MRGESALAAEIDSFFINTALRVMDKTKLLESDKHMQHGHTSVLWHSIAVAYYSYKTALLLGFDNDMLESLITGALLHDYFLYDWHVPSPEHRLHGFRHPGTALGNALRDVELNEVEKDIILRHMFPLTAIPPRHLAGLIVCAIDKGCSILEILWRHAYAKGAIRALGLRCLARGGV